MLELEIPNTEWTYDALSTLHVGSFLGTTKFTKARMYDLQISHGLGFYDTDDLAPVGNFIY